MVNVGIYVVANTTMLETYLKSIPRRLQGACTDQAKRSAEDARLRAPKDTHALSESVYWIDARGRNNYNQRSTMAERLNPRITSRGGPLPPIAQPPYPGAAIAVSAPYGAIVNGGYGHDTEGNHRAGDPFFTETVAVMREEFPTTLREFMSGNFLPDQNADPGDDDGDGGSSGPRGSIPDHRSDHRVRG